MGISACLAFAGKAGTDADYAGVLSWSYNKFRPTYEGGVIFVTANLTGADGSTQSYDIPFLVDRRYVHHIMSNTSGVSFNAYVNNDGNAFTNTTFTIPANFQVDPNNGNTLSLPSSYNVTFRVQTPTYNASTGDITWSATTTQADSAATLFRHVIVCQGCDLKAILVSISGHVKVRNRVWDPVLQTNKQETHTKKLEFCLLH